MDIERANQFGLHIAKTIISCNEDEWPDVVNKLRRERQLSTAIHQINNLQRDPDHVDMASAAMRRMGFH